MTGNSCGHRACPSCGDEMYLQGVPDVYWCDGCEREYWREGDIWWSCDVSGVPERVEVATDGGGSGSERLLAFECPECGRENPLHGTPESFLNRVFECMGCGESILLDNYVEECP